MFSVRTLFLFIRGVDQTGRAYDSATKKLMTLEEQQKALAQSSYRLMFAGAAFMAFGTLATKALMSTLDTTTRGIRILNDFDKTMERIKKGLAEAIVNNFGDEIQGVLDKIDQMSQDEGLMNLFTTFALPAATGITIVGAELFAAALLTKFVSALIEAFGAKTIIGATLTKVATGLSLGLPVLITLTVAWLAWEFLIPEETKKEWKKAAEEEALRLSRITIGEAPYNPEQLSNQIGSEAAGIGQLGFYGQGAGSLEWQRGYSNLTEQEVNIFIESINTRMDTEEMWDVFGDQIVKLAGAEGMTPK